MKKILAIISSALLIVWLILLPILTLNGGVAPTPETEALVDDFVLELQSHALVMSSFHKDMFDSVLKSSELLSKVKHTPNAGTVLLNLYVECRSNHSTPKLELSTFCFQCCAIEETFDESTIISKLSFSQLKNFKSEISDLKLECDADLVDTIDDELELRTGIYIAVSAVLVAFAAISLALLFKKNVTTCDNLNTTDIP